ncbi:MAG: ribosome silencing factor [Acidimicrobiales bacterium]
MISEQVAGWAASAARAAEAKGGQDTLVLDVGETLGILDAFVITSAANRRQVKAVAEEVELRLKAEAGLLPRHIEGLGQAEWILMDYGDLAVHIFGPEARDYYQLAKLWRDAPRLEWQRSEPGAAASDGPVPAVGPALRR